jgi:hypothetical protein
MRHLLPRVLLTLLLAAMVGLAIFHHDLIDLTTLDVWLVSLGPWAPIAHISFLR